ncbi:putative UDP-rhamnose:rhamnosyltransferase 1 [Cryptomeria japonica]|uniref:putative UDP-rhamnose:rhamnosyltransferase 1 n=1 Tax=Cryptomeria japonica TaxID=3369 RepID=UPI0027DAA0DB|nr:putative UDP-rhamnose:rhamnosyltransferase 1 [Cryptomeria japonica]
MGAESKKQLHVLMFPWLAQGHIGPFVELSKRLANHGLKVTFLSTPRNTAKIRPLLLDKIWKIDLVELPLPSVEGLPAGAESTADVPNEMEGVLKTALDGLEKPFEELLQWLLPDYVVHDFSQYWAATVAAKFGIPAIFFLIFNAATSSYLLHPSRDKEDETTVKDLTVPPPDYPSTQILWRPFEARYVVGVFKESNGQISVMQRFFKSVHGCSFIIIRSCLEMEDKFIQYLERAIGKAVVPVGPLPPDLPQKNLSEKESFCLRWLDKKPTSSVVYVSFGSECFLSKEQIGALARGLEATGLPFLWVLRFPHFSKEECSLSSILPEGFESRTGDRGLVYSEWAPQLQILAHPSVGVFLSHSGWSSVVEAVKFGVKLVLLPMNVDQGLNARLVGGELKLGLEVEREEDGSFTEDHIRTAVLKVVKDECEERTSVKSRMSEMRESMFGDSGWEEKYINQLIKRLDFSI